MQNVISGLGFGVLGQGVLITVFTGTPLPAHPTSWSMIKNIIYPISPPLVLLTECSWVPSLYKGLERLFVANSERAYKGKPPSVVMRPVVWVLRLCRADIVKCLWWS